MFLLGGFSCVETSQVGHGKGAGDLGAGLAGEATGTGASFPLPDTVAVRSFDSGCSIRLAFSRIGLLYLPVRVKRIQRLSAAARFSQPAQGLIPIAYVTRLMISPRPISSSFC